MDQIRPLIISLAFASVVALNAETSDVSIAASSPLVELEAYTVSAEDEKTVNLIEIDLDKAEQFQANSLFDLFENESSFEVAGGGASNAKRIYFRGVESSTLNIAVDGATQGKNVFQHRGNELGINPDLLKVVDARTSSDASKCGALGGSIEMSTKDAQDFIQGDKTMGGIVKLGYSSNPSSELGSLTVYETFDEHYGVLASVSGVNADNYEDGQDNEMLGTAYQDRDYFFKFSMLDLNENDLRISINQNSNTGDMQWGKTGSDKGLNVDPALLEEIEATTTSYSLQHSYSGGRLLNPETDLYLSNILVDRLDADSEYENDRIGLRFQNHFHVDTAFLKNTFSLGFQIEEEESTSNQTISVIHPDNDPAKYEATSLSTRALFLQSKTSWGDLDLNYGLRFDDYDFETGLGEASDSTLSPNFGLEYRINEKSTVYSNYAKASRMSGTIPFTWMMHVVEGATYSEDLEAEKSTRYELGYEFTEAGLFVEDDTFIFNISIFKTDISDLILSYSDQYKANGQRSWAGEGGAPLTDMYNDDKTNTSKGFEVKMSYYLENFYTSLAYSQIDTNTLLEENGEPLTIRRVSGFDSKKVVLNVGANITSGLVLDYTLTTVAGIDNDQIVRGGYTTHDISAKYKPSETSPWTVFLAVNNLTDKYYAPHTTLVGSDDDDYRREIGRSLELSLKYEF
jgi:hemoglobin/transferrin/lactoferrin receptor protein